VDTAETVVAPSLEESDPLGSFPPEDCPGDVLLAGNIATAGPIVAEVSTIRAIRRRRARIRRAGFRAGLLSHLKHLETTVRARWARSRNWNSLRRLKTVRIRPEVSRWTIRFSIFAVGVAVGVLTPPLGNRSDTSSSQLTPSAASVLAEVRPMPAAGNSPAAVGTALVVPPPSVAPAPAAPAPRLEASPRAPGHRGTLVVTSQPGGARVFVNNRLAGQTPLVMNALPAGSRAVRLSLDGYAAWSRGVSVVANQSTTISATLELNR
jgi:hypothetical protein